MLSGGELADSLWLQQTAVVVVDLASAMLLRWVAAKLLEDRQQAVSTSTAFLAGAAAISLAGWSCVAASMQTFLLLGALAAALAPGGMLLSATLLTLGSADWLAGVVLLAVPFAMLSVQRTPSTNKQATLRQLAAYCVYCLVSAAALVQLRPLLPPKASALLNRWVGIYSWQGAVPQPQLDGSAASSDPLAWVGTRASQQPFHQRDAVLLPAASLQPGLGLQWYLLAQSFPKFRAYFLYVLQALPAATIVPLALRFPGKPQLLLAAGAVLRCLLHPRPTHSMAVLCVGLLPLAHHHLAAVGGLGWHGLGMVAALLLNDATLQLWLDGRGGNANFLYGMNLLWGGLQVLLLLRLLRAAARAEAGSNQGSTAADSGSPKQRQA